MGGVVETFCLALVAYTVLVVVLRLTGKRVLSKWNSFDFVVTVAFGSSLAAAILPPSPTPAQSISGFVALAFLQFVVTKSSVKFDWFERFVKARPRVLFARGRYLQEAMREERVTESEVRAAIRARGHLSIERVSAVVLETDGSFSVFEHLASQDLSALEGVTGVEVLKAGLKTGYDA